MNGRLGAALLVAASIAAPPLAAWAASGSPGGTIPIPGTAFRLGMPLSLVDSMVSMRIAGRPSSPKRRNGLSRFFGLDAATTLDFESARLTHARFELKEISTHSRDYIEDQLRREGLKPQCALWDAEHHDCDWSNGSVMHVTWEQGSLTADVAAPEAGAVGAASVASSAPAMSAPAEASPSAPASAAAGLAALPMLSDTLFIGWPGESSPSHRARTQVPPAPPVYPAAARQAGVQGVVRLVATVDARGRVRNTEILRSIPELDRAAAEAARSCSFVPLGPPGTPQGFRVVVQVRFTR